MVLVPRWGVRRTQVDRRRHRDQECRGGEQGDVLVGNEATVEQLGDLDRVVELANTVVFGSLVVLENDKVFDLFVPDGEVNGSRTTTDTVLGAATNSCFKLLQEGDDTRVGKLHHP